MFIQTEQTPNPATLKFLPGRMVVEDGTANFPDEASAARSPLAQILFSVDGVIAVFFGHDFVTVTKDEGEDWQELKPAVLAAIMEHFLTDRPVLLDDEPALDGVQMDDDPADAEIIDQIKVLLDEKVRPAVAGHGGDIIYRGFQDGAVYLFMQGACAGCPSSTATLKYGIENLLKHYVPEVTEVREAHA